MSDCWTSSYVRFLFKYCGIIGLLVNIPITICITVIPPLHSPPLPYLPTPPLPHPPSLPTSSLHPLSPPSLRPLPTLCPPPSLPSLQQIHCPFQPKQSPSYNSMAIHLRLSHWPCHLIPSVLSLVIFSNFVSHLRSWPKYWCSKKRFKLLSIFILGPISIFHMLSLVYWCQGWCCFLAVS